MSSRGCHKISRIEVPRLSAATVSQVKVHTTYSLFQKHPFRISSAYLDLSAVISDDEVVTSGGRGGGGDGVVVRGFNKVNYGNP
jgi:hypothetical protein